MTIKSDGENMGDDGKIQIWYLGIELTDSYFELSNWVSCSHIKLETIFPSRIHIIIIIMIKTQNDNSVSQIESALLSHP